MVRSLRADGLGRDDARFRVESRDSLSSVATDVERHGARDFALREAVELRQRPLRKRGDGRVGAGRRPLVDPDRRPCGYASGGLREPRVGSPGAACAPGAVRRLDCISYASVDIVSICDLWRARGECMNYTSGYVVLVRRGEDAAAERGALLGDGVAKGVAHAADEPCAVRSTIADLRRLQAVRCHGI